MSLPTSLGPDPVPETTLIWDASAVNPAARADRLDVLIDLASSCRHVMTAAVVEELARHGLRQNVTDCGFEIVHVDGLTEIVALARWVDRAGATEDHNRGEATVLAWADVHGATAMIDDRDARIAAQRSGVRAHGTLWLIIRAVIEGRLSEKSAARLVDTLRDSGARYPTDGARLHVWARDVGMSFDGLPGR